MSDQDIRWKQRFQNFEKAFNQLSDAVGKKDLSVLEKAGCIQFYEFTFLAIKGKSCSTELALKISGIINEQIPVPYSVDVVDYNSLENADLKAHIDRVGLEFYKRFRNDLIDL